MRALILQNNDDAAVASSRALIDKGFQILCVKNRDVAETLIRMDTIDLLVMDEQVDGCLTHAIALSGERKNPYISSIIVTDRTGEDTDDLFDLIPSLYALVGGNTAPHLMGQLAYSSVTNLDDMRARVHRQRAADAADEMAPDDLVTVVSETVEMGPMPQISQSPTTAPIHVAQMAEAAATIAAPKPCAQVSLAEEDIDIPSYADVIFATPALAELAQTDYFDDDDAGAYEKIGPVLPNMAAVAARHPLVLTGAVSQGVPA